MAESEQEGTEPGINKENTDTYFCETCKQSFKHSGEGHLSFLENSEKETAKRNGSKTFIEDFLKKDFMSPGDDAVVKLDDGQNLTEDYFAINGFKCPVLVLNPHGLGITLPSDGFSAVDVLNTLGHGKLITVIEVSKQSEHLMTLEEWVAYFQSPVKKVSLNVLSLEFSNTDLAKAVSPPKIVLDISWVSKVWPSRDTDRIPQVHNFCLMSSAGSYTDFHIDFSGSSVWYHVFQGEKQFYLIPPTQENLDKFENWMKSEDQSYTDFSLRVPKCYKLNIKKGETVFLPSGWIHAVYTPVDSLVFGGNYMNSFNVEMQLKIYAMEINLKTPEKYYFPQFERLHWYVGFAFANKIRDSYMKGQGVVEYVVSCVKTMLSFLEGSEKDNLESQKSPEAKINYKSLLSLISWIVTLQTTKRKDPNTGVTFLEFQKQATTPPKVKERRLHSDVRQYFKQ